MAKKRFTDDLFGLFEDSSFEEPNSAAEHANPAVPSAEEEAVEVQVPVRNTSARRKLTSKGFTQDLDAFMSDSFEREAQRQSQPTAKTSRRTPSRRRRAGLDLLIRSTVRDDDEDQRPRGSQTPETKRVTLIFNKQHLVKLKEEAKERKMYLKDVVQEMVAGYLNR